MKKKNLSFLALLMLMLAMAMVFAGCGDKSSEEAQAETETTAEETQATEAEDEGTIPAPEEWTSAATAEEAAEAAALDVFDVPDECSVGDIAYSNPAYSYLDKVAQASYETGASMLYIRKANGVYGAPLTDRDLGEFSQKWTQNFKGLEVECYGFEKDKAIVVTWTLEEDAYAITSQGLGGEEVPMDADDIASLLASIQ